jgi:hypothetical protein
VGSDGVAEVTCYGITHELVFETTISDMLDSFTDLYFSEYDALGIMLYNTTTALRFLANDTNPGIVSIVDISGTSGVVTYEGGTPAVRQVASITLSGTNGTANITCDGVTKEVSLSNALKETTTWNTRGGSEAKPLLEIIGDELADQYSRPKQLVQMPVYDDGTAVSYLSVLGHYQDDLNKVITGSQLVTQWNNNGFDYLDLLYNQIVSATDAGGSYYACYTNNISLTENDIIKIVFDINIISGSLPSLFIGDGTTFLEYDIINGYNVFQFEAPTTDDYIVLLNGTSATNLTAIIEVYKLINRAFVFNRGAFNVKSRTWNMDLIEII